MILGNTLLLHQSTGLHHRRLAVGGKSGNAALYLMLLNLGYHRLGKILPFCRPVVFEHSSEMVLMFQPSPMRLTVKEWYVSFAKDVHQSVMTLRCRPSSHLAILEGRTPLIYFMPFLMSCLEWIIASFLRCGISYLNGVLSTT